jgi:hypothetical protein
MDEWLWIKGLGNKSCGSIEFVNRHSHHIEVKERRSNRKDLQGLVGNHQIQISIIRLAQKGN